MANNNNPIDGSKKEAKSEENIKVQPKAENAGSNEVVNKDQAKEKSEGQPEVKTTSKPEAKSSKQPEAESQEQSEVKAEGQLPQSKAEGQQAPKEEEVSTGKGPKPVGPNKQTWENPKPGEELKKEIDDQLNRLKKLGENPSGQDPEIDELNKKQDIESRNEDPEQEKKLEKNTQDNFDPAKHKTEAPTH